MRIQGHNVLIVFQLFFNGLRCSGLEYTPLYGVHSNNPVQRVSTGKPTHHLHERISSRFHGHIPDRIYTYTVHVLYIRDSIAGHGFPTRRL